MFKKQGEKEQIRVRRLGLLRELSQVGDRVPVLPFIDTEVRFSLDTRRVLFNMENVLTTDKVFIMAANSQKGPDQILLSVPSIAAARRFGAFVTRQNVVFERRMRQRYTTTTFPSVLSHYLYSWLSKYGGRLMFFCGK